jgi:4-hydroxymandelate oxidase
MNFREQKPLTRAQSHRRRFLQYLAASPIFAGASGSAFAASALSPTDRSSYNLEEGDLRIWDEELRDAAIKTPAEALDLFDLELAARRAQAPAHWGFISTGVDGNSTLRANRADFLKFGLLQRRMRGPISEDLKTTLFGETFDSPIFACPAGGATMVDSKGPEGLARGTAATNNLQMLSIGGLEAAAKATGGRVPWAQYYCIPDWDKNLTAFKRAEDIGAKVLVLTIDIIGVRKEVTGQRLRRSDGRKCIECHDTPAGGGGGAAIIPRFKRDYDWDFIRRVKDSTKMKLVLKGIMSPEDGALAVKYGVDGVFVSNHGGRSDDFGISSISMLPEIAKAVNGKAVIFFDGGIRRGVDVVKAIAMGATAVGIGRPWLWGLGSFGEAGVRRVFEILRTETIMSMQQSGAGSLKGLTPSMIRRL